MTDIAGPIVMTALLLTLGFYVWPHWPIQNRGTRLAMWAARITGVILLVLTSLLLASKGL